MAVASFQVMKYQFFQHLNFTLQHEISSRVCHYLGIIA